MGDTQLSIKEMTAGEAGFLKEKATKGKKERTKLEPWAMPRVSSCSEKEKTMTPKTRKPGREWKSVRRESEQRALSKGTATGNFKGAR